MTDPGRANEVTPQRRWRWRILVPHRPRLLRFWRIARYSPPRGPVRNALVYVGERGTDHHSPLLVLGLVRHDKTRRRGVEVDWCPGHDARGRAAERPLFDLHPALTIGRIRLWSGLTFFPGQMYVLQAGWEVQRRRP